MKPKLPVPKVPGNARWNLGPRAARLVGASIWALAVVAGCASDLTIEVQPRFEGLPLMFDELTRVAATGQRLSVTRLDLLLSGIAARREDGSWIEATNSFVFVNGREGRTISRVKDLPAGRYNRLRFQIGVPAAVNHANPNDFPAGHPLNPNVNGLHWSWQGGYVFLAIEGNWEPIGVTASGGRGRAAELSIRDPAGYSYHLATDRLFSTVEIPAAIDIASDSILRMALDVERIFSGPNLIRISSENNSTHSRSDDELAAKLEQNIAHAFRFVSATAGEKPVSPDTPGVRRPFAVVIASNATPFRLEFSRFFPQPALPLDNPLTEEGVELGRRLFEEKRLSIRNRQSCASCHQDAAGFVDAGKRFSLGADGQAGVRNAMPLFNLAWKRSYFWDGRAPSLREQVLMPIQNPIEMHESLSNVVAKLRASVAPDYSELFARAFGTADITADRLARALEQFLLVQVSHDSKLDRVLEGRAEFTEEEKRGFELFHTEYDPRRGQFGADCFHCHGGPLFQSQSFANNGLDASFRDPGRAAVTGLAGDAGKFAVPSLRNVAVTGPYMHDGRFATLEAVVGHYAGGVKRSATLDPNLSKHPDGGVPLSAADRRALVAFLETLTDGRFVGERGKLAGAP